jgi:hypothetical protein
VPERRRTVLAVLAGLLLAAAFAGAMTVLGQRIASPEVELEDEPALLRPAPRTVTAARTTRTTPKRTRSTTTPAPPRTTTTTAPPPVVTPTEAEGSDDSSGRGRGRGRGGDDD